MDPNNPIDMEAARRAISRDLISAAATPDEWAALDPGAARIRAIDAVTDRAARLGICRPRDACDPRLCSSGRKPRSL